MISARQLVDPLLNIVRVGIGHWCPEEKVNSLLMLFRCDAIKEF